MCVIVIVWEPGWGVRTGSVAGTRGVCVGRRNVPGISTTQRAQETNSFSNM